MRSISVFLVICLVLGLSNVAFAVSVKEKQYILTKNPAGSTKEPIIPVIPEDDDPEPSYIPVTYSEPVYIPPVEAVTSPDASSSWEHGDRNYRVEWNGLDGALIKIEVYKDGVLVDELSGWEDNTGSYVRYTAIPSSWGSGMGFQIRIFDNLDNELWSDRFQISAPITVSSPAYGSRWATGETGIEINWSGAEGSSVKIQLYKSGQLIEDMTVWINNTGSYQLNRSVPLVWGTGSDYQVIITDNLQNSYPSSNFSIDPIWVQNPSDESIWYKGRIPGGISWSGGGAVVKIDVYRGSSIVHSFTSGWIDNDYQFNSTGAIPGSWQDSPMYRIKITSMDSQNNTIVGWSDYFEIKISNDVPEGADPITSGEVSSEIEESGDIDYWSFQAEKDFIYEVDISSPLAIQVAILNTDVTSTLASERSGGDLEWYCHGNGEYLILVSATDGISTGNYSIEIDRKRPPEKKRDIFLSAGYGTVLTELSDVISGGYILNAAYLPLKYAEVGINMYGVTINADAITSDEDISLMFVGGYAGLRSPEFNRLSLRGGAGYYTMTSSEDIYIKHEYSDYVDAINDGLRFYGGLDYKVAYDHFGYAMYLQLQHLVMQGSGGLTSFGVGFAF